MRVNHRTLFSQTMLIKLLACILLTQTAIICTRSAKKLSFNNAAYLARLNRDDLEAFTYAHRASKYNERAALAGYLPQISVNASASKVHLKIAPTRTISVDASQLIFQADGPLYDYKIAKETTHIIKAQKRNKKNIVRTGAEQSFFDLQKVLLQDQFIQTRDITSRIIFEQNTGKKLVGLLNQPNWLLAAANYASNQATVTNYTHELEQAISVLQRETNTPIAPEYIDLSTDGFAMINLHSLDYYLIQAQKNRPELTITRHRIQQEKLIQRQNNLRYIPRVSTFVFANHNRLRNGTKINNWSVGVTFDWHFDGLGAVHQAQQHENQKIEQILIKKDLELQIEQEVTIAYHQVHKNIATLKATVVRFSQAEATLAFKEEQQNIGAIAKADLAQTELDYERAQFDLESFKIEVRSAYQHLLFVCGYPYPKKIVKFLPQKDSHILVG